MRRVDDPERVCEERSRRRRTGVRGRNRGTGTGRELRRGGPVLRSLTGEMLFAAGP